MVRVVAIRKSALTYLHGGLRVGIVCWLEAQRGDADLVEERLQQGDEVPKCEVVVSDEELYLVELGEVRGVHRLVSEHAVDGKVLFRGEHSCLGELLAQLVAGARATRVKYIPTYICKTRNGNTRGRASTQIGQSVSTSG